MHVHNGSEKGVRHRLTISIATKDRPAVVDATLRQIYEFGLGDCAVILCDDGSHNRISPPALSLFRESTLLRNERPTGQAEARNRIVSEADTPYVLQLDDDSYPVEGDIEELLAFADAKSGWLAIALPFREPLRGRGFPAKVPSGQVPQLKAFVGCSVLIHAERFKSVGGYAEWIERTVEEDELCLRAAREGFATLFCSAVKIQHDVTAVGRDKTSIAYRSIKNWTLVWLIYAPLGRISFHLLKLLFAACSLSIRHRSLLPAKGYFAALNIFFAGNPSRRPLDSNTYRRIAESPHALDLYASSRGPSACP